MMNNAAFFSYLDEALTPFHAAHLAKNIFQANGFTQLSSAHDQRGLRCYIDAKDGSTCALILPKDQPKKVRILAAHNDSPALRVKESPILQKENLSLLNIEVYGGPLLSTWFDRPLKISGCAYSKGSDWAHPQMHLVTLPHEVTIPSLAIHMKREPGDINPQKELLPIWGDKDAPSFLQTVADAAHVSAKDLLSHELFLTSAEHASSVGVDKYFYTSPRIDNLANAFAATTALSEGCNKDTLAIFVSFQNEEIGSHSQAGAASPRLTRLLEKLAALYEMTLSDLLSMSLLLSCDQAHAAHPNYPEKADPILRPRLGDGVVLKIAANHSYATTPRGEAIFRALCQEENIPFQIFFNRADMRGGSTIGPISETAAGIETIDIGCPMLAMHSIREMADLRDQVAMLRLMKAFINH